MMKLIFKLRSTVTSLRVVMAAPARRKRIVLYGDSLTQRSFEPYGFGAALVRLSNVSTRVDEDDNQDDS